MAVERIKTVVENILSRVESVDGRGEEATKQAMVLPLIEALGFDIWNPAEVCPEYEADTAVKKSGQKEKVDLAILVDGEPQIFIEVKPYGELLDGHHGQLKRYFSSTPSVALGILTNGTEYRFFTDTGEMNIQDDSPFFVSDFESVDSGLDVVARFQKSVFSGGAIREFATELKYTAKIIRLLRTELDVRDGEPSESFVRWVLSADGMYDGRVTANVVERFKPITKAALQKVLRQIVRRSVAAIDEGLLAGDIPLIDEEPESSSAADNQVSAQVEDDKPKRKGIVTTDSELEAFAVLKKQFESSSLYGATIYDPAARAEVPIEIGYRDTTGYFNIYFNKATWWNVRLSLESKVQWVGFKIDPDKGRELTPPNYEIMPSLQVADFRVKLENGVADLEGLNELVIAAFEQTIADKEIKKQ